MEIVVEYVLLDNFLIDALLLTLTIKALHLPLSKWGIVCASSFGAGFAVVSPLIPFEGIFAILLKLAMAFVMSFMVCFSFKKIFSRFLIFVLYTFAFGGALIGIFTFMGIQVYDAMYIGYVSSLPLGTLLVCLFCFGALLFRLLKMLARKKIWDRAVTFSIDILGKSKKIKGFVDTGNTLKNSKGNNIIVLPEKELKFWFNEHQRMLLMFGKGSELGLKNLERITVNSLGGSYKMLVFDCLIDIEGKKQTASIGISNGKFKCGDCQAIIGSDLLEAVKC